MSKSGSELTKTSKGVSTALSGVGRSAGMAGIQVQQFVGQVQGGQSAMLALSQQGADLGFVLGAPLLGAVVGIGASIIGMASSFGKANTEMKETSEITKSLVKDFDSLDEETKKLTRSLLASEIRKQEKALKALKEEAADAIGFWDVTLNSLEENREETEKYTANITALELAIKKSKKELEDLGGSSKVFTEAITEQEAAIANIITSTVNLGNTYGFNAKELALYEANLLGANEAQLAAIETSFERVEALEAEAQALKDISNISERFKSEEDLLREKLEKELEIVGENKELRLALEEEYLENLLNLQLKADEEAAQAKEKQEKDREKRQNKLDREKAKQKKVEDKIAKDNQVRDKQVADAAMSVASMVFEDNKAVSAGIAAVNTARAITEVMPNYAMAAVVAATGAAQIAAILGASKGGGSAPTVAAQPPQQEEFTPETSGIELTEQEGTGGVQTQRIIISTDDGNDIFDGIARGIEERRIQGA